MKGLKTLRLSLEDQGVGSMEFKEAIKIVLKHEGGYVWDSNDSGGETNYGISKRAYPNLDIKNLTKREAIAIYKEDYWKKTRCDELPESYRLMIFDTAVNAGVFAATIILQRCLGVTPDGAFGPVTLAATKAKDHGVMIQLYAEKRLDYYHKMVGWKHYSKNWSKRILKVTIECLKVQSRRYLPPIV